MRTRPRFAAKLASLAAILAAVCSCAGTKNIPEGKYILKENVIKVTNSKTYSPSDLTPYLKQAENDNLIFGIKSLFSEPILLDESLIEPSCNGMVRHLEYLGYYGSGIETSVERGKKKAKVNYLVTLGKQYPIKKVEYAIADTAISAIFRQDSLNFTIREGQPLSEQSLETETERLAALLRSKGYYGFTKNYFFNFADTTTARDSSVLKIELRNYTRNESPTQAKPHLRYTISKVEIETPPNLNVKQNFLKDINRIESGMPYSEELINTTYSRYTGIPLFNTVNISLTPGDSTDVDCKIALTPSKLQSYEVNMEASTNSSALIGISPSLSYKHLNLFGGGEVLTLGFRGNFQFKINDPARSNEFAISSGITFPKMLFLPSAINNQPTLPATEITLAYNYQNRPEYNRNIISSSYGYIWSASQKLKYNLNVLSLNIIKIFDIDPTFYSSLSSSYLQYQYQNHFDLGANATVYYTNDPSVSPKGNHFYVRWDVAASGNILNLASGALKSNSSGESLIWGIPFSHYIRNQVTMVETLKFGRDNKTSLAGRLLAGVGYAYGNSHTLPLEQMFYAGGASSMRGWQSRTVGPGCAPLDETFAIYNQTGDLHLEANLELRFPLFWKLKGALFTDVGNIWNLPDEEMEKASPSYALSVFSFKNLAKSTAVSWGTGARLDFDMLLVRVDVGFKGYDPASQHWLAPSEWFSKNGFALHLGIGYPF